MAELGNRLRYVSVTGHLSAWGTGTLVVCSGTRKAESLDMKFCVHSSHTLRIGKFEGSTRAGSSFAGVIFPQVERSAERFGQGFLVARVLAMRIGCTLVRPCVFCTYPRRSLRAIRGAKSRSLQSLVRRRGVHRGAHCAHNLVHGLGTSEHLFSSMSFSLRSGLST